jgi:phenylalanyl-tRNA synthetase alpha chain
MSADEVEQKVLAAVRTNGEIEETGAWAASVGLKHDEVLDGALKRFASYDVLTLSTVEKRSITLLKDGENALKNGSPEVLVFNAVPAGGKITKQELDAKFKDQPDVAKLGHGEAMRLKWIAQDKAGIFRNVASVEDTTRDILGKVKDNTISEEELNILKRRRMAQVNTIKTYKVTKGPKYTPTFEKVATDITSAMLASGSWKDEVFKPFNFDALGRPVEGGHLHPLMKVRAEIREIFIGLGFEEMATNNYVESSFWNFDALYTPQQHPVRDAHDTFFLKDPSTTLTLPTDGYVESVGDVHAKGGFGSIGYRYDWKVEEAKKNILRTHTTAVSTRMLRKLALDGFKPSKLFSIDRVFRNETLDATHLAEFHQIEGLVADYNITLANLMGVISQFFQRLGIDDIRFKPAFNPYTEPSMEIFGYHPILKRWVELGNSGMFRPEMLLPLGLPPDVRVIAWGLSLERPTMIKYGIPNIRDIFGPKIDINFVKSNPICFIDSRI